MAIKHTDVSFYCDATNSSGFGHGSRCAKLAKIITNFNVNISVSVKGNLSLNAKKLMIQECPKLKFYNISHKTFSKIGFIDMMFNSEDPNTYDIKFIHAVEESCRKTIFLTSGTVLPKLRKNITCIGYQPTLVNYNGKNIYWGFKFAPTSKDKNLIKNVRENDSIFIALGGFENNSELHILIDAINHLREIKKLDILLSPVNKNMDVRHKNIRSDLKIKIYKNIKTVDPFLSKSALVIASYGNICFEALAYNAPLCIIAQKLFQLEYAKLLESKNMAISIGIPSKKGFTEISNSIKSAYKKRHLYSNGSSDLIETNGLKKIANIIINKL